MKTVSSLEDFELIPSYDATPEEKEAVEKLMRQGNRILKIYHQRAKAKMSRNYGLMQFCADMWRAVKKSPNGSVVVWSAVETSDSEGRTILIDGQELVGIPHTDLAVIQKVKKEEFRILSMYARFIYKRADYWAKRNHQTQLTFTDFYNEAVTGAMKAIYYFDLDDTKFITFLYRCIDRTIQTAINKNKPLSHWLTEGVKLYGEFEKVRHQMGLEVTFDEVVAMMELDEDTISDLRDMLVHVVNHSQIRPASSEGESEEGFGIHLAIAKDTLPNDNDDVMTVVQRTPMTEWERAVLNAYLTGTRGWATEVADTHVNPETNRPYSRRAPKLALDRVLARIRSNIENQMGNYQADAA